MKSRIATVDFETFKIQPRPAYPPRPASVAIHTDTSSEFLSWGHPTGNNTTREKARRRLAELWNNNDIEVLHHNGKFDADVADTHLELPVLPPRRNHDTMFLAFLTNPHRQSVSLAAVAFEELRRKGWKDGALREWVIQNIPEARRKPKEWGAYIALAPAQLVSVRATGDARTTHELFKKLHAQVVKRKMEEAYMRERRIMPLLLENEREGIRVDLRRLKRDLKFYEAVLEELDEWIRRYLKAPDMDLDKGAELAKALEEADAISDWVLTKKGNKSTAKQALVDSLDDKRLLGALLFRGPLATCIRTFMKPWIFQAEQTGGWVHTSWNQVRQDYHSSDRAVGAKTGRLSSTPNFQNVQNPDRAADIIKRLAAAKVPVPSNKLRVKFGSWTASLQPLPQLRDYIIADDENSIILVRDYSQQEFRILAHFEDGKLLAAYKADPTLDVHDYTKNKIAELLSVVYDRRPVKDINFGLVYGMGLGKLAMKTNKEVSEVKELKRAVLSVSNIKELNDDLKARAKNGKPLHTWGGREYYVEEPKVVDGKIRTFEYKMLNTLIQGSAADNTKEALARYHELKLRERFGGRFLLTVHDETVLSAPKKYARQAMEALRRTMESVEFDLPMLSDGKFGPTWARLKKFNDERK